MRGTVQTDRQEGGRRGTHTQFAAAIVTYSCTAVDCWFRTRTKQGAIDHQEETGHQWFAVRGRLPGAIGVGWAA